MFKRKRLLAFLGLLGLCVAVLPGCRKTPDEEQVRQAISAIKEAAEAGQASAAVEPLSEEFDGNAGQLDRKALANMLRMITLRGDRVGVLMGPVTVEPRGERLVADFTVTLSSGGKLLPDQMGVYKVETAWRLEGSQWRCYTASWKRTI